MINKKDIELYDNSNMFEVLKNFGHQIEEACTIGNSAAVDGSYSNIKNVIICGHGRFCNRRGFTAEHSSI